MMDMSGMMVFMVVGGIVLIAAIVAAVWWLANRSPKRDSALVVLCERYTRGEISRQEYESRRRDLAA